MYHQILAAYMASSDRFNQYIDAPKITEGICYRTLKAIRQVLADDSISDGDCFQRIEQIVLLFEEIGSDCGTRHDFG